MTQPVAGGDLAMFALPSISRELQQCYGVSSLNKPASPDSKGMARPSITPASIVVAVDQDILTWTDGLLSGTNRTLVENAKIAALAELEVPLSYYGPTVPASLDKTEHPARIVAALMSVSPGRARILQCPDEVVRMMEPGWEDAVPGEELVVGSWDDGSEDWPEPDEEVLGLEDVPATAEAR